MRRKAVILTVGIFLMLTVCLALGGQALDVPGHVDRAIRLLLSPDRADEQCRDGLVSLLDAIVQAAPAARLGGTWLAKVEAARQSVASGRLGDSVVLLGDSYRAVHGKPFKMPATIRSLTDATDYIRGQLSSVRTLLDQGRADEAVRRMLEAAVMVVTPIEAPAAVISPAA
jgi:hypothetical protein